MQTSNDSSLQYGLNLRGELANQFIKLRKHDYPIYFVVVVLFYA